MWIKEPQQQQQQSPDFNMSSAASATTLPEVNRTGSAGSLPAPQQRRGNRRTSRRTTSISAPISATGAASFASPTASASSSSLPATCDSDDCSSRLRAAAVVVAAPTTASSCGVTRSPPPPPMANGPPRFGLLLVAAVALALCLAADAVVGDYENTWNLYYEQPCCSGGSGSSSSNSNGHHIRHQHRENVREFSCGKLYYRTFHLDESRDTLFVGAMDRVFRINLENVSMSACDKNHVLLEPTGSDVMNCISKGKSQLFECRNHIRVIQSMENGSRLYICGTNAHNPKDYVVNANLTHIPRSEYVPGIGLGIAKCPYDPLDNSTAIYVESGNPGGLPALYSGTNAEFTKADTVIFRTDLYNMSTGRKEYNFKRTLKYDSKWLDKPNFVGSFDIGEYVYFFFRETAVEYINCGKAVYSRIARVCKKDTGGKNILSQNWATYLKARLNCSISGEFPFYFNEIQAVYQLPTDKTKFYATFTTSTNGLVGSAVCSFDINEINGAFAGKFKEQATSNSAWLPVLKSKIPDPRPGTCVDDTASLPDTVLNFIRSHPLMDSAVNHEHHNPVFYKRDLVFTKLVVDKIKIELLNQEYTVYYIGTNLGRIYKIVQYYRNNEPFSKLLDIFEVAPNEPIQVMEISQFRKSLYVATDHRIKQIDLAMCNRRYDSCFRCVKDPYCGWDKDTNVCKPYTLGALQDVGNDTYDICDTSVLKKKVIVTYGQSVHLGCFVKIPEVLKNQQVKWYHHSKEKGREEIKYSPVKYIETTERGLVVITVNEGDGGRYDCILGGSLLCSYSITVDAHRCTPPHKSTDYQKIYSDWCNEFEKYKSAMKSWEKKQVQCAARQNYSNQHPNDIIPNNPHV